MNDLNVIWGLQSSNTRTPKVEKYDFPVVTLLPTPTEKGKSRQLNFNTAAVTALGIEKTPAKVQFGRTPNNDHFFVQALETGNLKITGANNVSSKNWHIYLCNLVNGNDTSDQEVEFELKDSGKGFFFFTKENIISNTEETVEEPVSNNDSLVEDLPFEEETIEQEESVNLW